MDQEKKEPGPSITFTRTAETGQPEILQVTFRSHAAFRELMKDFRAKHPEQPSDNLVDRLYEADDWGAIEGTRRFKNFGEFFNGKAKQPSSSSIPPPPPSEAPVAAATPPQERRLKPPPKPKGYQQATPTPKTDLDRLDEGWEASPPSTPQPKVGR